MGKRIKYTDKYINDACNLVVNDGLSVVKAAKKVKVHHTMLRKWIKNSKGESSKPAVVKLSNLASELQAKIQELQDEIVILERAADILG